MMTAPDLVVCERCRATAYQTYEQLGALNWCGGCEEEHKDFVIAYSEHYMPPNLPEYFCKTCASRGPRGACGHKEQKRARKL